MREKLEFKILGFGLGILAVGVVVSCLLVLKVVVSDINRLAEERLRTTARVIMKSIERTMLDADPVLTRAIVADMKTVADFRNIEVYNWQGREAFKPDAPLTEEATVKRAASAGEFADKVEKELRFYMPLRNTPQCRKCHLEEVNVLGAVKVSESLEEEYATITGFVMFLGFGGILSMAVLGMVFWQILRRLVIRPLKTLETAAADMAGGDLTFKTDIKTNDEIGRLDRSVKESLLSISGILQRVREISGRISSTADSVERDSSKVIEGTQLETEAVGNISSSVEQFNASITEIADSTGSLASSVEDTASSMEEMAISISSVTDLTHELSEGIEATSSSIEELSSSIKEIAGNSGELARVSEETLSAIEEIIGSIKEVESSAKESARLSEKVAEDASTLAVTSINKTIEGMQKIRGSVEGTATAIKKLGGRSEEIGSILNVIDEITDQTTLLALNAAILAAQAGEHGKGFSVVADEIKDLAERTAFSTQEIGQLIQAVRTEVGDAVDAMKVGLSSVEEGMSLSKEAADALKKMLDSSTRSSVMALSIERATTEQAKTARLVSDAIENVRSMVDQIAKATSEQSKGVSLIINASERMRDASRRVNIASDQQSVGSKQVAQAIEVISEKTRHISKAIFEQKAGSNQIWSSITKIKDIPEENRNVSFSISRSLQELLKDAELLSMEMQRFVLLEDATVGSVMRFGVVPVESPAEMFRKFTPLAEYLGKTLARRVELRVAPDYKTAMRELGHGITQVCFVTPATYIQANKMAGSEPLVTALRSGKPYHRAVIVTKEDSPVRFIKDIRNKTFAFGDINSTSGHIVPRAMLLEEGIQIADLAAHKFLAHHDSVARSILKGEFDVGAVRESIAYKYREQGLRFVKFSEEIPEFGVAASKNLSEAEKTAVKAAFLKLSNRTSDGIAVLSAMDKAYTGFAEASDEDFAGVREMLLKLGML